MREDIGLNKLLSISSFHLELPGYSSSSSNARVAPGGTMFPVPPPLPPPDVEARVSQIRGIGDGVWMIGLRPFWRTMMWRPRHGKVMVLKLSVWSNYLWNTIWYLSKRVANSLLGKDTYKQLYGLHLLGNTTLSHCHTQHCRKNVENALALNIEMHTLHQLQSFSVLTLKNTKCKHHESLGTKSYWNKRFAIHISPTARQKLRLSLSLAPVPAMGRKRHAIGAPGDDTVPSLRYCLPGKGTCLIFGMEHGLEEPGSIHDVNDVLWCFVTFHDDHCLLRLMAKEGRSNYKTWIASGFLAVNVMSTQSTCGWGLCRGGWSAFDGTFPGRWRWCSAIASLARWRCFQTSWLLKATPTPQ